MVEEEIEGGIGGVVVEVGNVMGEGWVVGLVVWGGRVEVGDVVEGVFVGRDGG